MNELWNQSKDCRIAWNIEKAVTFVTRLKGWMGRNAIEQGSALVIRPCNSIHTCFMRQAIDVLFLDRQDRVVGMYEKVEPYRFPKPVKKASCAIELPAGTLKRYGTNLQDQLIWK